MREQLALVRRVAELEAAAGERGRTIEALRESEERLRAASRLTSDFAFRLAVDADVPRPVSWTPV